MIVVLNNKCNLLKEEFIKYQSKLSTIESKSTLVLCPPSIYLSKFYLNNFNLGSQNVSSYYEGAYTGEISATQLKDLNVKYCIVGHSERRKYQHESNEDINKKLELLLDNGIIPILCVGENEKEKLENMTMVKVINEIKDAFKDIEDSRNIIIAYEPIWAIGSGKTPSKEEIENVLRNIKNDYPENTLLYGGSITEKNITNLKDSTYIDGYLLGGLSLKIDNLKEFLQLLDN